MSPQHITPGDSGHATSKPLHQPGRMDSITGEEAGGQQHPIQTIAPPSVVPRVRPSFLKVICFHLRGLRPSSSFLIKRVINSEF